MKHFKQSFSCVFLIFLMLAYIVSSAVAEEQSALSLVGSQGGPELTEGDTAGNGAFDDAVGVLNGVTALTFYTDRPTFNALFPGLPLEDFEEGIVSPGGVGGCSAPIDENTNNGCFVPGDILPGIAFSDNPGPSGDGIALVGAGFGGAPSKRIVANYFAETFDIFFPNNDVYLAGMDLACYFGADTVNINIYGTGGALIGTTTGSCTPGGSSFWGVSSDQYITRINISSPAGQAEGVDNIAFGGIPDLTVSYLPTATAGKVGSLIRRLSVKYRVMNQGTANAAASELDFYLSRDTALNVGDVYVGTVNIPALAPGAQAPLPYGITNFLLPVPAPAVGVWKVLGVADANDDNAESDETNNVVSTGAVVMGR